MVVKSKRDVQKKVKSSRDKKKSVLSVKKSTTKAKTKTPVRKAVAKKTKQTKQAPLTLKEVQQRKEPILIKDNTKKNNLLLKRKAITPAVQSPFRFPIPLTTTLSKVALSFGVFFTVAGSLLTILTSTNTGFTTKPFAMVAETISSLDSSILTTTDPLINGTTSATDPITTVVKSPTQDPKPVPTIHSDTGSVLYGKKNLTITVPYALEMKLLIVNTYNQIIPVGVANKLDPTTWNVTLDTTKFENGIYRMKLYIKNEFGLYDYLDAHTYEIKNVIPGTSDSVTTSSSDTVNTTQPDTATADQSTQTSIETTVATQPVISFAISGSNPQHGKIGYTVNVLQATSVKLSLRNKLTGVLYSTGFFNKSTDQIWKLEWDSTKIPNGTYIITPRVVVKDVEYKGTEQILVVDNPVLSEPVSPVATTTSVESAVPSEIPTVTTPPLSIDSVKPDIDLKLSIDGNLSGYVTVAVNTSVKVDWVELYVIQTNSLFQRFVGLAKRDSDSATTWKYSWQTTQIPNGDYLVYARTKSEYGFVEGSKRKVTIQNKIQENYTDTQENTLKNLQDAHDSLIQIRDSEPQQESDSTMSSSTEPHDVIISNTTKNIQYVEPVETFVQTIDSDQVTKDNIRGILVDFRAKLKVLLADLAKAKRHDDSAKFKEIQSDIESLQNEIIKALPESVEKKDLIDQVNKYLSQVSFELSQSTIKNETILKERVGDAVLKDSDKDGISDYDEINLYKTDPFTADTDGDGFNDGVELQKGFNPLNSASEAAVVFESPKETGIVREDILVVDSVGTIEKASPDDELKAIISGKALPNSFVTLYIFSTPIIVTVKTDENGNWDYVLDKALDNGEHEVYVGITDNEGKIVAKSNPIPFVKTAEAYTEKNTVTVQEQIQTSEPSLIKSNILFTIASIIVLSIGLVLVMLGLHIKKEEPDFKIA